MIGVTKTARPRELTGLAIVFAVQLTALLALCLAAAALAAAVAFFTVIFGPSLSEGLFWPVVTTALALGGLVIVLLAWWIAHSLAARRAERSPQFKTRRSVIGAIQLALPPIIYLLFAYILFIAPTS